MARVLGSLLPAGRRPPRIAPRSDSYCQPCRLAPSSGAPSGRKITCGGAFPRGMADLEWTIDICGYWINTLIQNNHRILPVDSQYLSFHYGITGYETADSDHRCRFQRHVECIERRSLAGAASAPGCRGHPPRPTGRTACTPALL